MVQKTILFGILNWGLGHASRSIPVIRSLIRNPAIKVIIVADGDARKMLLLEFPTLQIECVDDIQVRYKSGKWLPLGLLLTGLKLLKINHREHKQVSELVGKHHVDIIISDNRYGFWNQGCKNILITHQLTLLPPKRFAFTGFLFKQVIRNRLTPFDEVWVPDFKEEPGIAGVLSHQTKIHPEIRYIGLLSRYCKESISINELIPMIAIVSGPMPFRKLLADKLIQIAEENSKSLVLFTADLSLNYRGKFVEVRQNATFKELNRALNCAEIVIASAGYTSIMDLISLNKRAVLIPTPEQSEQVYLAKTNKDNPLFDFLQFHELYQLFDRIEQLKNRTTDDDHQFYNNDVISFTNFLNNGL